MDVPPEPGSNKGVLPSGPGFPDKPLVPFCPGSPGLVLISPGEPFSPETQICSYSDIRYNNIYYILYTIYILLYIT